MHDSRYGTFAHTLILLQVVLWLIATQTAQAEVTPIIWANDGHDKITQDEMRASEGRNVRNSIWDGSRVHVFGAKNEVVSFNIIIEEKDSSQGYYAVEAENLDHINGKDSIYKKQTSSDVFSYQGRNIELFYVRYLQIKGLSQLTYTPAYDERHVPARFRLPFSLPKGTSRGRFVDRPDANKMYPDIAVPMELVQFFPIAPHTNQSVWVDIYIPETATAGDYAGSITITRNGRSIATVPVSLEVLDFALPNTMSAKTMVWMNEPDVNARYTGIRWYDAGSVTPAIQQKMHEVWLNHHLVARRHRISLITDGNDLFQNKRMPRWASILDGSLFTKEHGYVGPCMGAPADVYSIGTYGSWRSFADWGKGESEEKMHAGADKWLRYFADNYPRAELFLYLLDEPRQQDFEKVERWASWLKSNPGPGRAMKSLCTTSLVKKMEFMPSLDISFVMWGDADQWRAVLKREQSAPAETMIYNGWRPASGTFMTEDDGVALRVNGWIQYKHAVSRWFYWAGTNYKNPSFVNKEVNVFREAVTFGRVSEKYHEKYGETGANYGNGDGVLFYPGTDVLFPADSYGIPGPIASLRLKMWRRGLQDYEYLKLAATRQPAAVEELVRQMVPKSMWELGVTDKADPSYVHADISWSTNPDDWEAARRRLAEMIGAR
ncbi:DUF4091 domain-containing protein [Megalodesulfovibrio paquesii]